MKRRSLGRIKRVDLKVCSLVFLFFLFTTISSASSLFNPIVEGENRPEQNLNLSVQNTSQAENLSLKIIPPKSTETVKDTVFEDGRLVATVNGSFLDEKGIYRYKFVGDGLEFPQGTLTVSIASTNQTLEGRAKNFSNNISESESCNFRSNDFSCGYENWQAQMMLSNAILYKETQNETYRNRTLNYSLSDYGSGSIRQCNRNGGYNCQNDADGDEIDVSSGHRQGTLINSLWSVYSITQNSSVKNLALNYTEGSAENCDVWGENWNKSFECGTAVGQGSMIQGYWTAYQVTGNQTYRKIAENLSETNHSSPRVARGLLQGYELTGNTTYEDKALNITKTQLEEVDNASERKYGEMLILLWEGYDTTTEYGYYRNAVNLTATEKNYSCSAWRSDYRCSFPDIQGLYSQAYWDAFNLQKDLEPKFSNPRFQNPPEAGKQTVLQIEMQGKLKDPYVLYRSRNGEWKKCEIDFFNGCRFSKSNISAQGVYEYRLLSNETEFPVNGSFRFPVNLRSENLKIEVENFSTTNPESYCAPWSDDYVCEDAIYQASMIEGFGLSYIQNKTSALMERLLSLSHGPYREEARTGNATCDPSLNDFDCESGRMEENVEGSVRQGELIDSLFSSYRATENETSYENAVKFARGSAEDCDVWAQVFSCGSSRGQGSMIQGYWTAYRTTGNQTYRKIAENLSERGLNYTGSENLAEGMWKTYSYTNNTTYLDQAVAITEEISEGCESDCTITEYIREGNTVGKAYLYHSNSSYEDPYRSLVESTTSTGNCGPYKTNYNCSNPEKQGKIISLFSDAYTSLPLKYDVTSELQISPDNANTGDIVETTCSVENNFEDNNLTGVQLSINMSSGLSTPDNQTYEVGDLATNQTADNTWEIEASSSGTKEVECTITSSTGFQDNLVETVQVSKETKEEESGGSSEETESSGVLEGSYDRIETIYYDLDSIEWDEKFLAQQGLNTVKYNFSFNSSCLSAERRLESDNSSLRINYSCESSQNITVIDGTSQNYSQNSIRVHKFSDLSNTTFKINYNYSGSKSEWEKPVVLFSNLEDLKLNLSTADNTVNKNSTSISAELNRPAECAIWRNYKLVKRVHTDNLDEEISLEEGSNSIRVECGDHSESYTVVRETESNEKEDLKLADFEQAIPYIVGVSSILAVLLSIFTYRETIFEVKDKLLFKWYFKKFQKAVGEQNVEESIRTYSKLSTYAQQSLPRDILDSNIDLMRGLRVYLLMDLVEQGIREGVPLPPDKIEDLVMNYLNDTEDEELSRLINRKLEQISKLDN